jgi:hypothetical protein
LRLELVGAQALEDPQLRDRALRISYVVGRNAASTQVTAYREVKYRNRASEGRLARAGEETWG